MFQLGPNGETPGRPLVPFVEADDYDTTGEMVAYIRGKGGGRRMFDPSDQLPPEYDGFNIDVCSNRMHGAYNRYCVVADEKDTDTMLNHGAAQVALRGF